MLKSSAKVIDGVENKELYYLVFRNIARLYLDKDLNHLP